MNFYFTSIEIFFFEAFYHKMRGYQVWNCPIAAQPCYGFYSRAWRASDSRQCSRTTGSQIELGAHASFVAALINKKK